MTFKQKQKLANLLADHRGAEGVADYLESPTMSAVFTYVDKLIATAKLREEYHATMRAASGKRRK